MILALENVLTCHYVKHGMECKPTVAAYVAGIGLLIFFFFGLMTVLSAVERKR